MSRVKLALPASWATWLPKKLLASTAHVEYACHLNSNQVYDTFGRYQWLCALGKAAELKSSQHSFKALRAFRKNHKDWLFGHLSYELQHQLEEVGEPKVDDFEFRPLHFFVPQHVFYQTDEGCFVESFSFNSIDEVEAWLKKTESKNNDENEPVSQQSIYLNPRTTKEVYLEKIKAIKQNLQYGNIYELNYCQSFEGEGNIEKPHTFFDKLNEHTKAPFSAFYKLNTQYVFSASPERFLQKTGNTIRVQPIKGTAKRGATPQEDEEIKDELLASEKERAENVMIVDLMRNDLSRTAEPGSVKVDELFGIYSYPAVHQMISTISSKLDTGFELEDLLKTTLPVGSMTGAPKPSALQLIHQLEDFNRSLYSGSIGYITPHGNADFNVVIRSIMYNAAKNWLSVRVGGAITILSDAEAEYEECLLKAKKLFEVLA